MAAFDPMTAHMVFPNVRVLDKFQNAKGTKCVKIGWMTNTSVGDQMFFGDDVYDRVQAGDTVTIKANKDGDFFRGYDISGGGGTASLEPAVLGGGDGSAAPAPRKRRTA